MHTWKATYTIFNEISSNILSTGEGQQEWSNHFCIATGR